MVSPKVQRCQKLANRNVWSFGWEVAHAAVSRRPPIPLSRIVAHTHMYTYAANVWNVPSFKGHFLSPRAEP